MTKKILNSKNYPGSLHFTLLFLSKKSFDQPLFLVFLKVQQVATKDTTGFQIYHYGLILELVFHAKFYQRLSIFLKTLLLPRYHHQKIDIFRG